MKICKLKLKNLNSFRESVEIDFENSPLDDASLVAITGPTGAGKTTLLDAICVALYDKTPRLNSRGSQNRRHLISHGEKEGFAEVIFMVNGTKYLAAWSIGQIGSPRVELRYADNEKLITDKLTKSGKSLGSSQRTVSEEVESILGLDFDAFTRSVMLAQGEFAAFLKADKENRRNILEATAGVHIYDILGAVLNQKVAEVKAAHDEIIDKLKGIPEASHDQLKNAEAERDRLQAEVETLGENNRQIQEKKERETKRKEDFEKLQSAKKRQEELLAQQPEINALQAELENADRARRLRLEKQEFENAKSELENAEKALRVATTGKMEAETQVETDQTVYDAKTDAYQTVSDERNEKLPIYTAAKLDVAHAAGKLADAEKREPGLVSLSNQIDAMEDQLTDRETKQTELQGEIDDAQRFLEDNPLPSDRQQRLTRVTGLLTELDSQEKQLKTASENKAQQEKKVSSLKQKIKKLSGTHAELLSEKSEAEIALVDATTQLNGLLSTGTQEEWTARRQQASKAQSISQRYEATQDDLADAKSRINALNGTVVGLEAELEQIETDLENQTEVCQEASEVVQRCKAEQESAKWAAPINQLRQHLHDGKPCRVCGATEHPYAGVVESEDDVLLQNAKDALAAAEDDAAAAEMKLQDLREKRIQTEQKKQNTADQIETCTEDIETLRADASELLTEWQEIYPDAEVSLAWTSEQFDTADTAIADIVKAEQTHTKTSNALQIASQQLKTCENDIKRETDDLSDIEAALTDLSNTIADLQANVARTETRFWESMPDTFHGVKPTGAVERFDSRIKEVAAREDERRKAETDLQVLNVNIKADRGTLQNLKDNRETLKNEKAEYLCEREAFLTAAREKTGGLKTENEINEAIAALETDLQTKADARDTAEQQLQNSQNLLTQKQTAHEIGETQFNTAAENLDASRQTYFNKLEQEGFDAPEAHDDAFRDDGEIKDLSDRINTHTDETQRLVLEITEWQARFEETPYDPDALGWIETRLGELETQSQEKQKEIGAQEEIIKGLKDALAKRDALAGDLDKAEQEMERWQQLHGIISKQALRDFALEIMFKQMGRLANEQLKYLTSERYQLKVESIGDLAVVDRWNANEERPVQTLSGGESFLTSLALALSLSELSSGRAQLNSLFLDEGFGTLDSETLDIAIAALEGLRMQGRSIFLISHIKELTRRLPVKIEVNKKGNGSSSIDVRG